jgi:hypothetical protein
MRGKDSLLAKQHLVLSDDLYAFFPIENTADSDADDRVITAKIQTIRVLACYVRLLMEVIRIQRALKS